MKSDVIFDTEDHISENAIEESATKVVPKGTLLVVVRSGILANTFPVALTSKPVAFNQDIKALVPRSGVNANFLFFALRQLSPSILETGIKRGGTVHSFYAGYLENLEIPLPPLSVQEEIVAEIGGYQAVIDGALQVIDNWKPSFDVDPKWTVVRLGEVCDFKNGLNYERGAVGRPVKILGVKDFQDYDLVRVESLETLEVSEVLSADLFLKSGDIIFVRSNGNRALVGRSILAWDLKEEVTFTGFSIRARMTSTNILPKFALYYFKSQIFRGELLSETRGANIGNINQELLSSRTFPVPDISVQEEIVRQIEAERDLVNSNRKLIEQMQKKIERAMGRVWM